MVRTSSPFRYYSLYISSTTAASHPTTGPTSSLVSHTWTRGIGSLLGSLLGGACSSTCGHTRPRSDTPTAAGGRGSRLLRLRHAHDLHLRHDLHTSSTSSERAYAASAIAAMHHRHPHPPPPGVPLCHRHQGAPVHDLVAGWRASKYARAHALPRCRSSSTTSTRSCARWGDLKRMLACPGGTSKNVSQQPPRFTLFRRPR